MRPEASGWVAHRLRKTSLGRALGALNKVTFVTGSLEQALNVK